MHLPDEALEEVAQMTGADYRIDANGHCIVTTAGNAVGSAGDIGCSGGSITSSGENDYGASAVVDRSLDVAMVNSFSKSTSEHQVTGSHSRLLKYSGDMQDDAVGCGCVSECEFVYPHYLGMCAIFP